MQTTLQQGLGLFRVLNKPHLPQINSYPNGLHFSITDAEAVDDHLLKRRNKTKLVHTITSSSSSTLFVK